MTFFGQKYGEDLEKQVAHPHQEFPGVPPLPPFRESIPGLHVLV